MGQGISEVLVYGVGVSLTLSSIIAVTLMLFSERARVNGPVFLLGFVLTLAVVSGLAYVLADQGNASTSSTASDSIAWGKIVFGVLFLLLAVRNWRNRPAPGAQSEMPKWMGRIAAMTPGKALGLAVLLAGVNPKNLMLSIAAGAGLAQLGRSTGDTLVSLLVFVILGSLATAAPVVYYFVGGDDAKTRLNEMKGWLVVHDGAVTAVVLLIVGADLIAKGLPPLT
jgi:hypothetical protein